MDKKIALILILGSLFTLSATAHASNSGSLQEGIGVGKVLSIALSQNPNGQWYLGANSNSSVASAKVDINSLLVTGKSVGSTVISVCQNPQGTVCTQIIVSVSAVSGQVLGASTVAPHPYKSWVIEGQTVFYVDVNGLIPVTAWQIFLNNGGKQSLIQPADSADLQLPLESFMALHDSRVQK